LKILEIIRIPQSIPCGAMHPITSQFPIIVIALDGFGRQIRLD